MTKNQLGFKEGIKFAFMTIVGSVICCAMIPLLVPLFAVFIFISGCVFVLIKLKYGSKGSKAVGMDVLSGKETEESYPVINIAFRFNGKLDAEKVRNRINDVAHHWYDEKGNLKYKRLTQIYEKKFGYYLWRDSEQFDICQHVKIVDREEIGFAPSPTQDSVGGGFTYQWESLLKQFLNTYASRRFPQEKPLWELLLFEENDLRYTALFRFHHCIADGIYISRMLCEIFMESPTKFLHSYVPPTKFQKIVRKLWSFLLLPFGLWKILKNKDKNVLLPQRLTGRKRYFVSEPISLDSVKKVRKQTGSSVHGILFSCLSSALASHFKRRNTVTEEITTLIPMPLQNLEKPMGLKNRYAVISLKIPTMSSSCHTKEFSKLTPKFQGNKPEFGTFSPLERLNIVQRVLSEAKQDPAFMSFHSLINGLCTFFPAQFAESILSTKGTSVAFSSIRGPHEMLFFERDQLEEVMFWIPDRNPLGTAISVLSYNDEFRVGIVMDEALLEDYSEGDSLVKDFAKEIDNMIECLQTQDKQIDIPKEEAQKLLKTIP